MSEPNCTCTYGSFLRHGGGTGWDIAKYDPDCPVHYEPEYEYDEPKDGDYLDQLFVSGNPDLIRDSYRGK